MFLIQFNEKYYEKYFIDVLQQSKIPIIFDEKEKYFSKIEIIQQSKEIIIKNNQTSLKLAMPCLVENFFSNLMNIFLDFKVNFQNSHFYPINNLVIFQNQKIVLGDIHNKILTSLILYKTTGIDKFDLYKKIWPLDKDYQINKLDTHLSNFKNILMSNIKFEIQFSSSKGIIKLS